MHIIANLQPLLTPLTGIGHYTRELTLALLAPPHAESLSMEGFTGRTRELLTPEHPLLATCHGEAGAAAASERDGRGWQLAQRYLRNPLTRSMYRWLCTQRLQRGATNRDTLYWEPNYILLPWRGRSVVTVHDLSHQRHPEYHPRERVQFLERRLPESLARATRINVVSRFTAGELETLHGIDPARIDIVPPAVGPRFFVTPQPAQAAALKQRYDLPSRYLLSVGTLEPRKNLARVLEAYASLPAAERAATPLVLAGMQGWGSAGYSPRVECALREGSIRRLGYVPADDLPGLYAQAHGFVYASLYEGFGMPVLEAMAAGTPVLTSNVTATVEVSAGNAIEVNPEDPEAIRHGLGQLLDDTHQPHIEAGRERARQFTWQDSASRLKASFTHALQT